MSLPKILFAVAVFAISGLCFAQDKPANDPETPQKSVAKWQPFHIELIEDNKARGEKISRFVIIKSETVWFETLEKNRYLANAKLIGYFDPLNTPLFCTVSCEEVEPGRTVRGLPYTPCLSECYAPRKKSIAIFFAENQMNFSSQAGASQPPASSQPVKKKRIISI